MNFHQPSFKVAVLDDYQNVALSMADWSGLRGKAAITIFNDHISDTNALVARLTPYDVVCVMRERTPMTRGVIDCLPKLRLIASTGPRNPSVDLDAAAERGIAVMDTSYDFRPAVELTWTLILAALRNLVVENASLRSGGWQRTIGGNLVDHTLGVLGLGHIGSAVAQIGKTFGMEVIAWSQNLTADRAAKLGATMVDKDELLRRADIVTIHLALSSRTRGLIGSTELNLMKRTALLVNTSRGPIVIESELISALERGVIAGAAIDVFDQEPLPTDHPFRHFPNVLATPHVGYVTRDLYARFYQDTVDNICRWIEEQNS